MRLLSRVRKLAERAAGRRGPEPVGLVWSRRESNLAEGYEFATGEHLAVDVYEEEQPGGELPPSRRIVERATTDPEDLGQVYGAAGELVGRVCEVKRGGHLLRMEYFEGQQGATAATARGGRVTLRAGAGAASTATPATAPVPSGGSRSSGPTREGARR